MIHVLGGHRRGLDPGRRVRLDPGVHFAHRRLTRRISTLGHEPDGSEERERGRAAVADEGQRMPVMGMSPIVMPMFSKTEKARKAKAPAHTRRPKLSRAVWAARMMRSETIPNRPITRAAPTKPSCSPIAEKMKSVCWLGDVGQVRGGAPEGPVP